MAALMPAEYLPSQFDVSYERQFDKHFQLEPMRLRHAFGAAADDMLPRERHCGGRSRLPAAFSLRAA